MRVSKDVVEIMFWDLTPEAQSLFLQAMGMSSPDEGNYSVVPIAVVSMPEGED